MSQQQIPYQVLGKELKALRNRANESLAEASGAVEIEATQLAKYELGHVRPSEDVLLLLISHFGARDDEAVRLWEMGGYNMEKIPAAHQSNDAVSPAQAAHEAPIMFTDVVDITVNNYGVVMNFMQGATPSAKPNSVSRVGMSREHAKSVLEILKMTLEQTEQKISGINSKTNRKSPDSEILE